MSPFAWHPADLSFKLALAPHSWFDPLLEWYTPAGDFSRGTYFSLARWRNAGSAGGYVATQNWKGEFRECEFPLEELEALEKTLKAISISLGSCVFAFDGSPGLIRVYHGSGNNWIDLRYDSIEQPEWEPLLAFIHETNERFLPSPPSEMHDLFGEPEPAEPALPLCVDEEGFYSVRDA